MLQFWLWKERFKILKRTKFKGEKSKGIDDILLYKLSWQNFTDVCMVGGTKLPSRNICKIPWLCTANIFDRFQDFGCSRVDGFLPNGPSQKLKKHRVRVFEAKKQFLSYAAWGFATDRQGGPCWMLVDTKEQKRFPPLLHSLFPCKFCQIVFLV